MKSTHTRSFFLSFLVLVSLAASAVLTRPALASVPAQTTSPDRPRSRSNLTRTDKDTLTPGQEFNLFVSLRNLSDNKDAHNIILSFASGDLISRETGGTKTISTGLGPGQKGDVSQPMIVSPSVTGGSVGNITATLTYADLVGWDFVYCVLQYRCAYHLAGLPGRLTDPDGDRHHRPAPAAHHHRRPSGRRSPPTGPALQPGKFTSATWGTATQRASP